MNHNKMASAIICLLIISIILPLMVGLIIVTLGIESFESLVILAAVGAAFLLVDIILFVVYIVGYFVTYKKENHYSRDYEYHHVCSNQKGRYSIKQFVKESLLNEKLQNIEIIVGESDISEYSKEDNNIYIADKDNKSIGSFLYVLMCCFHQAICVDKGILYSETNLGRNGAMKRKIEEGQNVKEKEE